MNNEDLDSQLSAMFDGELPEGECELVARRLARDSELRRRWHHYAVIGASIRAERGVRLDDRLASRVSAAIAAEPDDAASAPAPELPSATPAVAADAAPSAAARAARARWLRPAAAVGIAASVAAVSILWLRAQAPGANPVSTPLVAVTAAPAGTASVSLPAIERSDTAAAPAPAKPYTVPPATPARAVMAQAELANYVVAHSEYSSPLTRRFPLSNIVSSEPEPGQSVPEPGQSGATPVSLYQKGPADAATSR